jgi:uncharacterized protein YidB (DUF937 family)
MGLLDSVVGALGQGGGAGGQGDLMGVVASLLDSNGPGGGLAGLVARFQQGGLGDVVQSWIATGPNLPVSADQLGQVLGKDTLSSLAGQLGLPQGDLAQQLSSLLPQVVDRLTPDGQLPQGGAMGNLGDLGNVLGAFLKR